MKIKVYVRGKSSEYESYTDIVEEIEIEDIDIIKMAIKSVKGNYENAIINEDDCSIDGISDI